MSITNTRIAYEVVPIKAEFLQRVRQTGRDDLNQPVERHIAEGGEPCRDALRRAVAGEELILASYCPFDVAGPYKEYGPVFVLAEAGKESPPISHLPIAPNDGYFKNMFVLRAYSPGERIVDGVVVQGSDAEEVLQGFLARDDVAFVLARFAGYGCYGCRIVPQLRQSAKGSAFGFTLR
jgi:hypothetical protein